MTLEEKVAKLVVAVEKLADVVHEFASESDDYGYKRPAAVTALGEVSDLLEEVKA